MTDFGVYESRFIEKGDDKLGILKRYLGSLAAGNKDYINGYGMKSKDINYFLANPSFRRFFSSEAPKKKSKIFL